MNKKEIMFEVLDLFPELLETAELDIEVITKSGYIPLKKRDPREPGRLKKIKTERKLKELFSRRLSKQMDQLRFMGIQKAKPKPRVKLNDWEEKQFIEELVEIILTATKFGILLFEDEVSVGIDYTMANAEAVRFARSYAVELMEEIDKTTQDLISKAVGDFIEVPGFTIGDIIDQLEPIFGENRATKIAVTETTRAYAQGQLEAARIFKEEFPNMTLLKRWETNADDRVCDVCGPLQGEEVLLEDSFPGIGDGPPAHVNCRCWINYYTKEGRDANR